MYVRGSESLREERRKRERDSEEARDRRRDRVISVDQRDLERWCHLTYPQENQRKYALHQTYILPACVIDQYINMSSTIHNTDAPWSQLFLSFTFPVQPSHFSASLSYTSNSLASSSTFHLPRSPSLPPTHFPFPSSLLQIFRSSLLQSVCDHGSTVRAGLCRWWESQTGPEGGSNMGKGGEGLLWLTDWPNPPQGQCECVRYQLTAGGSA